MSPWSWGREAGQKGMDVMKYTQAQIEEIVAKEEKRKERQRRTTQRQLAKNRIFLRKAREAGIVVTNDEILAEMSK